MNCEPKYDIHSTKRAIQVYDAHDANRYLREGWVLLAAGFDTSSESSSPCYILGTSTEASSRKLEDLLLEDEAQR